MNNSGEDRASTRKGTHHVLCMGTTMVCGSYHDLVVVVTVSSPFHFSFCASLDCLEPWYLLRYIRVVLFSATFVILFGA